MRQMKDSGIEWIGQIPQEWDVRRVKFTLDDHSGGSWGSNEGESETDCICVRVADFNYPTLSVDFHDNMTKRSYAEKVIAESSLKSGDILLEKSGGGDVTPVGRSVLFENDESMMCANFIEWLRPNYNYDSRFLNYWLAAAYVNGFSKRNVKQTTGIQNLDVTAFLSERIAAPTRKMQLIIANYLDAKCAEIDALIEAKEKTNALLRERRQSTIYEAVTKGLNPDVPMKDSGIEWIGQVPAGWHVDRLKYCADLDKEKLSEKTDPEYTFNYIDISSVTEHGGIENTQELTFEKSPSRARMVVHDGDTIISTVRTYLKAIAYVDNLESHICSTGFCVVTPNKKLYPRFAYFLLQSDYFVQKIVSESVGVSYPAISSTEIGNMTIAIPNISEQIEITNYLSEKCNEMDTLISANEATIQKLKEYRQSVIYEAVTGKIEV